MVQYFKYWYTYFLSQKYFWIKKLIVIPVCMKMSIKQFVQVVLL